MRPKIRYYDPTALRLCTVSFMMLNSTIHSVILNTVCIGRISSIYTYINAHTYPFVLPKFPFRRRELSYVYWCNVRRMRGGEGAGESRREIDLPDNCEPACHLRMTLLIYHPRSYAGRVIVPNWTTSTKQTIRIYTHPRP